MYVACSNRWYWLPTELHFLGLLSRDKAPGNVSGGIGLPHVQALAGFGHVGIGDSKSLALFQQHLQDGAIVGRNVLRKEIDTKVSKAQIFEGSLIVRHGSHLGKVDAVIDRLHLGGISQLIFLHDIGKDDPSTGSQGPGPFRELEDRIVDS